jgi:hypothetical protein
MDLISDRSTPDRSKEDRHMSSLIDRREFRHPYGWAPETEHPAWRDFALALTFVAIGLAVAVFAIATGIPIGEASFWNN